MAEGFTKKRTDLLKRWSALKNERSSFMSHWQEISNYLLPCNGRYFTSDRNRGERKHNNIYDNTGTRSLRILGAGLMAGATSPARPWFKLGTHDPELNQFKPVKVWMDDVAMRILRAFQASNTYRSLHQIYEELGAFGTGAAAIVPDYENVIHHYPLTAGEYCIATDWQGKACTLYREFDATASAIVKEFGLDSCSDAVKNAFQKGGSLDDWFTIIHAIEPRADRDITKRDARNMAWASYYFESGGTSDKLLRESGFKRFPAVVPRWSVAGGDIYGNSPGMEALGDIKQLQHEQLRKAQGIDYQTNPPKVMPLSAKNAEVNFLPGGTSYIDTTNPSGQAVRTAFEVNLNLQYLLEDIRDVRSRINSSFFTDLFLMIANSADAKKTATEIAMMQEEKMLMLGPVLERLDNELLDPLVDATFDAMLSGGALPPPPEELHGQKLTVEYIGILAQAQKAIGVNSLDRFAGTVITLAQAKPEVLDKWDADTHLDTVADSLGINPKVVVSNEQVAMIRDARNKAQAAQQQAELMQQQSQTAKNLAQSPTGNGSNGLQDLMNQFSGYGSPAATEV